MEKELLKQAKELEKRINYWKELLNKKLIGLESYNLCIAEYSQKAKEILEKIGVIGCEQFLGDDGYGDIIKCGWYYCGRKCFCSKCQIKQEIKEICERILR